MPFLIRNLSVLAYAQGFTMWLYRPGSALFDAVSRDGFFNDARDMFNIGDLIVVAGQHGSGVRVVATTAPGVATAALA